MAFPFLFEFVEGKMMLGLVNEGTLEPHLAIPLIFLNDCQDLAETNLNIAEGKVGAVLKNEGPSHWAALGKY